MQWFIVGLIVILGLAFWNHKRTQTQHQALHSSGFSVSHYLKGNPELLVSEIQQQLAVVRAGDYLRIDFAQVEEAAIVFDAAAANDRNFRIRLQLSNAPESVIEIAYQDELGAHSALKQLDKILGR